MKKLIIIINSIITMTTISAQVAEGNPFFEPYDTPHATAPFDRIKTEHYEPAFEKAMERHRIEIGAIASNPAPPTFANTILALEYSGEMLKRVSSVFFNLLSAESNDEMMVISQQLSPKLSDHANTVYLNETLFQRVKTIYETRAETGLLPGQIRLVEKYYDSFVGSGASLSPEDKERYRALSSELSRITLEFGQNNLRETNSFEMLLTKEEDLPGLPPTLVEAAAFKAKEKGKKGWLFDLSAPSYVGFMKYADRRDLREKLYRAYNTKGVKDGPYDNRENVRKIVNLRLEIARLSGYDNYAEYVLRRRMAKNQESVYGFLDRLAEAFGPAAGKEVREVAAYAVEEQGNDFVLQPWDWNYYSEKLKDRKFGLTDEMTRPYFELGRVKKAVFGLATDLYGLQFRKNDQIPVYHPEVEAYEVTDGQGKFVAVLYTDFHPRPGKRSGAWMTSYQEQYVKNEVDYRPHVSIVMNFTRPSEDRPALLAFDEVNTFLHEFGHALHGMLSRCAYETLSGTNVYRDFVELPSQIMENWLTEKEYLDRFATHYQTGDKMPDSLLRKIVDASNFNIGYATLRQLTFGYLDMAWHSLEKPLGIDILDFERKATERVALLPVVPEACISTSFGHIFSGGYAAGYYGYKWAEVMDADAFSLFKENGIFDKATAQSFKKNILERGNSEDPMVLYVRFRGHEPSVDALLRRSGITE